MSSQTFYHMSLFYVIYWVGTCMCVMFRASEMWQFLVRTVNINVSWFSWCIVGFFRQRKLQCTALKMAKCLINALTTELVSWLRPQVFWNHWWIDQNYQSKFKQNKTKSNIKVVSKSGMTLKDQNYQSSFQNKTKQNKTDNFPFDENCSKWITESVSWWSGSVS